MSNPYDLTILAELEKLSPKHGATDLITLLLKNYVIEMKEMRRHLLSSNLLLSRSKQALHSIEDLIDNVNSTASSDFSVAWADFEKYTGAIPILERILFDFYLKVPTGLNHKAKTHLPPADVIDGYLFIESWLADRKSIVDTLALLPGDLSTQLPAIANDLKAQWTTERRQDDLIAMKALVDRLVTLKPSDRWITQQRSLQLVSSVMANYQKIYKATLDVPPQSDAWIEFNIWTMTLVLICFEILSPNSTHQDKASFRSAEIWTTIKELLLAVVNANRAVDPTPELVALLKALKDKLAALGGSIPLVQDLLALVQKAARVRRPFHGRSVRLIQMVRVLELHVAKYPSSSDQRVVLALMKDTVSPLLVKAQEAVTDVQQYRLDSKEYVGMQSEFHSALTALENCYNSFELDTEWEDQKKKYEEVVANVDEKHLTEFLTRLSIV